MRMEPLFADITRDHILRLWLLANAEQLERGVWVDNKSHGNLCRGQSIIA